jgi:hypothetical protein
MDEMPITELAYIEDCFVEFYEDTRTLIVIGPALPEDAGDAEVAAVLETVFPALEAYVQDLMLRYGMATSDDTGWEDLRDGLTDEELDELGEMFQLHRHLGWDDIDTVRGQTLPADRATGRREAR